MNVVLCSFAILLSIAIYPAMQSIPYELQSFWGNIEFDCFHWYRMMLIGVMALGIPFLKPTKRIVFFIVVLLISFLRSDSHFGMVGTPAYHEGLMALLGYVGIFLLSKRVGLTTTLINSFRIVVWLSFLFCVLQVHYGNFIDFPPIKTIFPDLSYSAVNWPLYGLYANPNHLGLFCSLFLPFFFLRRMWVETSMLVLMLVGSESRATSIALCLCALSINKRSWILIPLAVLICFQLGIRGGDLRGRLHLWRQEIPLIRKDILIGDGPGTFPMLIKQDNFFGERVVSDRPHNLFLNIWQTSGLVSLVVLGTIALENIRRSRDKSLQLGVIAYLINSLFTDSVLGVTPYFLIFLGVMNGNNEEEGYRSGVSTSESTFDGPSTLSLRSMGSATGTCE